MDINKVLYIALEAGRIILQNGGETYRVEETIYRICSSYGINNAESFVTPTGIIVSVIDKYGDTNSLVKRVKSRSVNLEKVSKVNDLARNIRNEGLTCEEVKERLEKIDNDKRYSLNTTIFFSALSSSLFTLLFGGSFSDSLVAFFIGAIIKYTCNLLAQNKLNDFFTNIIGGAIAAFLANLSVYCSLGTNSDMITIGSIMLLVPGLAITNAIRDTLAGDLLAALSRGLEAILTAVAIALGTGLALKIWFVYIGGI